MKTLFNALADGLPVVLHEAKFTALTLTQQQAMIKVEDNINAEPFRKIVADPIKQLFAEKYGAQLVDAVIQAR